MRYQDRTEAGRRLAEGLHAYRERSPVVLGIPRGGVPVATVVAEELGAPLDVIVVRKLGVPAQPELAMGAVGEGGVRVLNEEVLRLAGVSPHDLAVVDRRARAEVVARARRFRGSRPMVALEGRTAILVDDGIATGSTMVAACEVVRALGAAEVVAAVPVAPPESVARLEAVADDVVCLESPSGFSSVGQWYADFAQTSDEEVAALLGRRRRADLGTQAVRRGPVDVEMILPAAGARLACHLNLPADPVGLVVFAHGSGSSRWSPRNQYVAGVLNEAGLGTVLLDLLSMEEERERENVFDIDLLSARLAAVTVALRDDPRTAGLPVGLFGASTGAAAALSAATERDQQVSAVVSRGGRPDLAGDRLSRVRCPTLLVVGGNDALVLELNRKAQQRLTCRNDLTVVPGATHLFEEPGALSQVAVLARDWFLTHLLTPTPPARVSRAGTKGARGR